MLQLRSGHRRPTEHLVEHVQQAATTFWLQGIYSPDQPPMLCRRGLQLAMLMLVLPADERQHI